MATDSPTVLIVDDEPDVVRVYELALGDAYDVRKAYDGEEALEKVDDAVDVVLLDRRMPGPSGRDVLEEIRRRDVDVRVGIVTAVDPDFDVAEMDFDAYLTKPVADEDVRKTVAELLSRAEYDDSTTELVAVAEKKAALEAEKTKQELAANDEYRALVERLSELEARTTESLDDATEETVETAVADRSGDGTDGDRGDHFRE
ncbi:response regulator [Halopenitus persicus]|uniref:response regulator n=1 Tax=Halopenitus persicus TaxID=1048396 RepID=UPI000BBA4724|nr:response regulator [Halopenitus persicus]